MLTLRYFVAAWVLLALTVAGAWAATVAADEFALVTTKSGTIQFGLVVLESDDSITLRSLKTLKDTEFTKSDLLSSKRNLDENDAFAQEELPYVLVWRLSKSPLVNPDGSARQEGGGGRLAIIPFAIESQVNADGLPAYQANLSTVLSQRKIEVIDPGLVQKTLTDLSMQDPLTPPVLPLGKTLKADWVFTGKVVNQDNTRKLHYRLIDVQNDRTLAAGVKALPVAGQPPATLPAAKPPEKKPVLAPAKAIELSGKWQIHSSKIMISATITPIEGNNYILHAAGVYGGEYQWRVNTLVMLKPSFQYYKANASEMMTWRLRNDGSLILTNTKWAGYYMTRDNSTDPEPGKAAGTDPSGK